MPTWLVPALLDAALKGAAVFLTVALVMPFLRRRSAAVRHAAWSLAVGTQLLLPLVATVSPSWGAPLLKRPEWVADVRTSTAHDAGAAPTSARSANAPFPATTTDAPRATPHSARDVAAALSASRQKERAESLSRTLLALWWAGAVLILLHLVVGTIGVWCLAVRGTRVLDATWLTSAHQIAARVGISRPLTLLVGVSVEVPITWGVVYPVVLLPADAESWDDEQRRYVLVHEMAHIRRFDALTHLVGQVTLAVFWFNPLVWLAVSRMRAEREHACDDYVLRTGTPPSRYANDLLAMVRSIGVANRGSTKAAFAALAMARRSEFEGRMMAILEDGTARNPLSRRGIVGGAVGMGVLALMLAGYDPLAAREGRTLSAAAPHVAVPVRANATNTVRSPASPGPQMRSGRVDSALASMRPDGTKAAVLVQYVRAGDDALLMTALRAVPSLLEDGQKSLVLTHAAPGALSRGDVQLRDAFFVALGSIKSDGDAAVPLVHALANGKASPGVTAHVLRATARMRSSQAASVVLINVAERNLVTSDSLRALYIQVATALTPDDIRQQTLAALLLVMRGQAPLSP